MDRETEEAAGTVRQAIAAPASWPRGRRSERGGRNLKQNTSSHGLPCRSKGIRKELFTRDTREILDFSKMLDRNRLPLANCTWVDANMPCQVRQSAALCLEVCRQFFHIAKFSDTIIFSQANFLVPLHGVFRKQGGKSYP